MIGVEGQYLFLFTIANKRDFLNEDNLHIFKLIEEAGNMLPTFELSFDVQDDIIISLINEKSTIDISFGKDRDGMVDAKLVVFKKQTAKAGNNFKTVVLAGFLSILPYLNTGKKTISSSKSALEVMSDITGLHFTNDYKIQKSLDKQRWIQPNISDRAFVKELWTHADLGESFPIIGISSDRKFIVKSVKDELIKLRTKKISTNWNFTLKAEHPRDIIYDTDYAISDSTGFMNYWTGYGRDLMEYDIEEGISSLISEQSSTILANISSALRSADVGHKFSGMCFENENVHKNYWNSFRHNITSLATFSAVKLLLSFHSRYVPIRILDLVNFRDTSIVDDCVVGFNAGLYFISRISREVTARQFVTVCELTRDALNQD